MRFPNKMEIKHETNYKELFFCLRDMKQWLPLLNQNGKEYNKFISVLLNEGFYTESKEKLSMKLLCNNSGYKSSQLSKWLPEIYNDIFELNSESPELFKREGIKHELYIKYYDSATFWTEWLLSTPRVWEDFNISFVKGKVGTDIFWVQKVVNKLEENEHKIEVWLKGGFLNKYREILVDRGLFEGRIGIMHDYFSSTREIDETLLSWYKK